MLNEFPPTTFDNMHKSNFFVTALEVDKTADLEWYGKSQKG